MQHSRYAVFIDGGFFLKRLQTHHGKPTPSYNFFDLEENPDHISKIVQKISKKTTKTHPLVHSSSEAVSSLFEARELYRCFYYDCPPVQKSLEYPLSKRGFNLSKEPEFRFHNELHQALRQESLIALRLGELSSNSDWRLKDSKHVCNRYRESTATGEPFELTDADFKINLTQKGVDMRIGLDIATVVFKGLADTIILVSGDSDFVPAAKLARREGCRFFLDPMGRSISPSLYEHIDGIVRYI